MISACEHIGLTALAGRARAFGKSVSQNIKIAGRDDQPSDDFLPPFRTISQRDREVYPYSIPGSLDAPDAFNEHIAGCVVGSRKLSGAQINARPHGIVLPFWGRKTRGFGSGNEYLVGSIGLPPGGGIMAPAPDMGGRA